MAHASSRKTKRCPLPGGCGKRRLLSKFSKDKQRPDGHCAYCVTCTRRKAKAYRESEAGRQKVQERRDRVKRENEELLRQAIERQRRIALARHQALAHL